jgi:hypothetical protein
MPEAAEPPAPRYGPTARRRRRALRRGSVRGYPAGHLGRRRASFCRELARCWRGADNPPLPQQLRRRHSQHRSCLRAADRRFRGRYAAKCRCRPLFGRGERTQSGRGLRQAGLGHVRASLRRLKAAPSAPGSARTSTSSILPHSCAGAPRPPCPRTHASRRHKHAGRVRRRSISASG